VLTNAQVVAQDFTVRRAAISLAEIVIGSRARHTAADELAVPVDVFTSEQIQAQGTTETSQILSQLAPSVNFPRQSVSDATEIVRPFTMRGLSADHTLVLLNGKRRHHTALIHYYGAGQGAGSSGVDMNFRRVRMLIFTGSVRSTPRRFPPEQSAVSRFCATEPPPNTDLMRLLAW